METLRVAVIGARTSIGRWQSREFLKSGAEIVAVVGKTQETADQAAKALKEAYDSKYQVPVNPLAYPESDLEKALKDLAPDAVSVCSSSEYHYEHAKAALEAGANVLCEKPVHWDLKLTPEQNLALAEQLFSLASKKGLLFTVNTQLAALYDAYADYYKQFRAYSAKGTFPINFPVHMITSGKGSNLYIPMDLLPHALSFLLRIDSQGIINTEEIQGSVEENKSCLHFNFQTRNRVIGTSVILEKIVDHKERQTSFGFEDLYVTRGEEKKNPDNPTDLSYYLSDRNLIRINVEDPLSVSVRRFCDAVRYMKGTGPLATTLIPHDEAIANIRLQTLLMNYLTSIYKPVQA